MQRQIRIIVPPVCRFIDIIFCISGILSDLSNCEMKYNEIKDHNLSLQNENNHLTSRLEEALSIGKLYNQK